MKVVIKNKKVKDEAIPVHPMKVYRGSRSIAPLILNSSIILRSVVNFTPRPLYPRKNNAGTHWIGGWISFRAGLEILKRKISCPGRASNPGSPGP